jgi:ferredoxin
MRYNHYFEAQGSEKFAMEKYAALDTAKADACRTCEGLCERACPYGVPVRVLLNLAHTQLTLP